MGSSEYEGYCPESLETSSVTGELQNLLSHMEFEEPEELLEARTALLVVLNQKNRRDDLLRAVSVEYAKVCEKIVDRGPTDIEGRAQQQIAMTIYKALIFCEAGDMDRCIEELADAEEYADSIQLEQMASAIRVVFARLVNALHRENRLY